VPGGSPWWRWKRGGEGVGRAVADAFGDFGETQLVHPQVVAGERHSPVGEAAQILGDATGQAIHHFDLDRDTWVAGLVANGVPDDYAEIMRALSQTIADGRAAQPTVRSGSSDAQRFDFNGRGAVVSLDRCAGRTPRLRPSRAASWRLTSCRM
jgi:hypothetical protein